MEKSENSNTELGLRWQKQSHIWLRNGPPDSLIWRKITESLLFLGQIWIVGNTAQVQFHFHWFLMPITIWPRLSKSSNQMRVLPLEDSLSLMTRESFVKLLWMIFQLGGILKRLSSLFRLTNILTNFLKFALLIGNLARKLSNPLLTMPLNTSLKNWTMTKTRSLKVTDFMWNCNS